MSTRQSTMTRYSCILQFSIFTACFLLVCLVRAADPAVSNVSASQRSGIKLVDITYDVSDSDSSSLTVSVSVSTNNGSTYDLNASSFSGTGYGNGVTPGTGKQIVWDAAADWDGNYSTQVWFKVTANDGSVPIGMALITSGSFNMGDNFSEGSSDELPVHSVSVSAFYIDTTEVTKSLWDEVYSWAVSHGYSFNNAGSGKASTHPVHTVDWYDCVKWCNARSEKDGVTPCYYTTSGQSTVYRTGDVSMSSDCVKWSVSGYRLPTEAEWEKAARGGLSGNHYPWNSSGGYYSDHIDGSKANYLGSGDPYETGNYPWTTPVGYYNGSQTPSGSDMANGYGLYDMAGNVWEWCWDRYSSSYYSSSQGTDPTGPLSGSYRVLRGASWNNLAGILRCADRCEYNPLITNNLNGFRCVRGL